MDKNNSYLSSCKRAIWERRNGLDTRELKTSRVDSESEDEDDDEDTIAEHDKYVKDKLKNKKRRAATEQALSKIKEQGSGKSSLYYVFLA